MVQNKDKLFLRKNWIYEKLSDVKDEHINILRHKLKNNQCEESQIKY